MGKKLTLKDSIKIGKKQKITVEEIIDKKGEIFKYIKEGYEFDDEVLEKAHIKKNVKNTKIISGYISALKQKEKPLPKETESVKNILKSLNTIEEQNTNDDFFEQVDEDVYSLIGEDE